MEYNVKFCPSCGTGTDAAAQPAQQPVQPVQQAQQPAQQQAPQPVAMPESIQNIMNTPDTTAEFDPKDIADNKLMAVLSYFGLLLLIPWFVAPNSKFARFHAKQGIALCAIYIVYLIISIILSMAIKVETYVWGIPTGIKHTPFWVSIILFIICLPIVALSVIGIINAVQGKAKQLPIIGGIVDGIIK